ASLSSSETFTCESSSDHGKTIGMATAFSVDGQKLNQAAPSYILCDFSQGQSFIPSYEIRFSSEESSYLLTHSEITGSLVVKVSLLSGQTQKSILANFDQEVLSFSQGAQVKETHDLSSASTLGAEEVGSQIAKKLGIPTDKFQIGELNSGFEERNQSIAGIIDTSNGVIDVGQLSQQMTSAATSGTGVMAKMREALDQLNHPANLRTAGLSSDGSAEIRKLLAGDSPITSDDSTFSVLKREYDNITGTSSDLLASVRKAKKKESGGVSDFSGQAVVDQLFEDMFAKSFDATIAATSTEDLNPNATMAKTLLAQFESFSSSDSNVNDGKKKLAKMSALLSSVGSIVAGALTAQQLELKNLELQANSIDVTDSEINEVIGDEDKLVQIVLPVAEAMKAIYRQQLVDVKRPKSKRIIQGKGKIKAKIEAAKKILKKVLKDVEEDASRNRLVGIIIDSIADHEKSAQIVFGLIREIKAEYTGLSSTKRFDFSDAIARNTGKFKNISRTVRLLASNANDASEAKKVLSKGNKGLTKKDLAEVLLDDRIKNEFALDSAIFVDPGIDVVQRLDGGVLSAIIKLDARNSNVPSQVSSSYQWFFVESDGTEIAISNNSESSILTETNIVLDINTREFTKEIKVKLNAGAKSDEASFIWRAFRSLPPIISAPKYIRVKAATAFQISAKDSFDPEADSSKTLEYSWLVANQSNQTNAIATFDENAFTKAGSYSALLTLSKSDGDSQTTDPFTTQIIVIKIVGTLAPIADAGYDYFVETNELLDGSTIVGLELDNYSFSQEDYDSNNLIFEWSPLSVFSQVEGKNATSVHPVFIATKPGTYEIGLKVTEGSQTASDTVSITIRAGEPPFADAGGARIVRLGVNSQNILLDGTFSFSSVTENPDYEWEGSLSFDGSSKTSNIAQITLSPSDFTEVTELSFTLNISDDNGTDSDQMNLIVVPSIRPPVAVAEIFPRRLDYRPGQQVELAGDFSFSPEGNALSYQWT
ncbi:hypothetical protein MJH12_09110, partial [bacterium]|nr:hypothetical protein [bacterium]